MSHTDQPGTALITGASSGIGAVYADRLARRGYHLVLVARDAARLETLAARLRAAADITVDVLPADLGAAAGRKLVEQRLNDDPSITLFVNNAGAAVAGNIIGIAPDAAEALIELNVIAATRLAITAGNAFAQRGEGAIINIASVVALLPGRISGVYSATKAFVLNFSQALAAELHPAGVRVQAVLPGATRTEIWGRAGADVNALDPSTVMEVDEMVDAALAGFDAGEVVTIPALPDAADWQAFETARHALGPNLSRDHAAPRYLVATQ
jgi:short-subunit dehydrogenase